MVVQHRLELTTPLIAQYSISLILTQLHWISYSAYTPMSATPTYDYDPLLSEGITFSRESRYYGTPSHPRTSGLRPRPSYGTMSTSPFDTVEELDEELEDDPDAFIKVDIARQLLLRRGQSNHNIRAPEDDDISSDIYDQSQGGGAGDVDGEEEEEHDMATLLAFQDARRQQVFAFSPTASSSVLPERSLLSPHTRPSDWGNFSRWGYQGRQDSYTSSYDMRIAAAGTSGAAAVASGGLTMGYTPRKRSVRSNIDRNGTGRRTWTGGHNIIYSGIFVEDSDDEVDHGLGTRDNSAILQDADESEPAHVHLDDPIHMDVDDTVKVDMDTIIKPEINEDIDDTTEESVDDAIKEGIDIARESSVDAIKEAAGTVKEAAGTVKEDSDDALKETVDDTFETNMDGNVSSNIDDSIKAELDDTIHADFEDAIKAEFDDTIKAEIMDDDYRINAQVEKSIRIQDSRTIKAESDELTELHLEETIKTQTEESETTLSLEDKPSDSYNDIVTIDDQTVQPTETVSEPCTLPIPTHIGKIVGPMGEKSLTDSEENMTKDLSTKGKVSYI